MPIQEEQDFCPVTQPWVHRIPLMQQSVLLSALRGPDGIRKGHPTKRLLKWYRRSILMCSFDRQGFDRPYDEGSTPRGGSFTGASLLAIMYTWQESMHEILTEHIRAADELPYHFQTHFMHGSEVLGYQHYLPEVRNWWHECYLRLVNELHLKPESEDEMNLRLGDDEAAWRDRAEIKDLI